MIDEKKVLLEANENSKKIGEMWEDIIKRYAGRVIAVEKGRVIGDAKTSSELIKKIEKQKKDVSSILIISVPPTNVAYIL